MLQTINRRHTKLTGIEGVSAGGVATVPITTGFSYDNFLIRYYESGVLTDVTLATSITRVRLVVDGSVKLDLTPSQILDFTLINGHTVKTGELPLDYTQPSRATVGDEEFTMLDLSRAGSAHLLVMFAAGATSPSIRVIAEHSLKPSARNAEGVQFIPVREALNFTVGGTGTIDISTLPKGKDISRLFFYHSGTSIDQMEIEVDGQILTELETDENDSILRKRGFTPQNTNIDYPLVVDIDQRASSTFRAIRKLLAKATVVGAGQIVVVVETLEPLR